MKRALFYLPVVVLFICAIAAQAAEPFVHPGLTYTRDDLVRIKSRVRSGEEPWKTAFDLFMRFTAKPDYKTSAVEHATIGHGQFEIRRDAAAAADLALKWYVTGDDAYRVASIRVIDTWTKTMQSFDPVDNLSASTAIKGFGEASEILRYEGGQWPAEDVAQFRTMMLQMLYPAVAKTKTDGMRGNQGIDAISAAMAVGIVCDVRQYFDESVEAWTKHPNCAIERFTLPTGQMAEAGRDQPHASGEIMGADEWANLAWNQGVDLYSTADNRLLASFEYWARYNLGYDVPFQAGPLGAHDYGRISPIERGRLAYVWFDRVYRHYVTRMGLKAPYLTLAAERMRPDAWGFGTLRFYAGQPINVKPLIADGKYEIRSEFNQLSLSVPGDQTADGVQLTAEPFTNRVSQRWTLKHLGMNVYTLVNEQGKWTDTPRGSAKPGLRIETRPDKNSPGQLWRLLPNPDGTLTFLNLNSSWALTLGKREKADECGLIQAYISTNGNPDPSQQWSVHPAMKRP